MPEARSNRPARSWRFATWNLDWWRRLPAAVTHDVILDRFDADVVALQEVRGPVARQLERTHPRVALVSQAAYQPASWRWMGCALLFRSGTKVHAHGVVTSLPKPQRSLWARVQLVSGLDVTVVSWHAPNAAGDGHDVKMRAFAAMTRWLQQAPPPVVIGADLNTWHDDLDPMLPDRTDRRFPELDFVGPAPAHGLTDAYRTVLDRSGELRRRRVLNQPGPLAVSYVLRNGVRHRMDRIYASRQLIPVGGGYDLDAAARAGSDHAVHWIDFTSDPLEAAPPCV